MTAVPLILLLVTVAATSAGAAGYGPQHGRLAREEPARLEEWIEAISHHRPGMFDPAALNLATWPDQDVEAVVNQLERLGRFLPRAHAAFRRSGNLETIELNDRHLTIKDVQRLLGLSDEEAQLGDLSRIALRGALLHTDIATLLTNDPDGRRVGTARANLKSTAVLVHDGREQGLLDRGPYWEQSRAVLDLIPPAAPASEAKRSWYAASAAYMLSLNWMAHMVPHVARALELYPDDPEILFFSGCMHETLASRSVQVGIREVRLPPGARLAVDSADAHLRGARTSFERALARQPELVEARVRLGRVLGLLGDRELAVRELQHPSLAAAPRVMRYYRLLFLGAELAALGQPLDARRAYQEAALLYQHAQAPRLGLSALARAEGDPAGAMAILLPALSLPDTDPTREDPWWTYLLSRRKEAEALLESWRRSVAGGVS